MITLAEPTHRLTVVLPWSLYQEAKEVVKETDISLSEFVRRAIKNLINEDKLWIEQDKDH